jgi:hypothetical protein
VNNDDFEHHCHDKGKVLHPLFQAPADGGMGLSVFGRCKDGLHVADIGVTQHVNGNVLWHLIYTDMVGGGPDQNMTTVLGMINEEYRTNDVKYQFGEITQSLFCDPSKPAASFPETGGKAAENRHLVPVLLTIWRRYRRAGRDYEETIERVLECLADFYQILDFRDDAGEHPMFLPVAQVRALRVCIDKLLVFYTSLTRIAGRAKKLLWNLTPKFHYMWHLGLESEFLTPRLVWNYANEDWVGRMSTIGCSTRHGLVAAKRSGKIAEKWCMGLALRMHHARLDREDRPEG